MTVGDKTYIRQQTKVDAQEETPLKQKLGVIATQLGQFGLSSAMIIVVVIWVKITCMAFVYDDYAAESMVSIIFR